MLPTLDLRLEVTDKLQLRFDASRTLTRPGLTLLSPVLSIGNGQRVGALSGSGGNPQLKPIWRTITIWPPNGIISATPICRSTSS
jgi:outer membrane receptor protein involved in Fe transport